MTSGRKRLDDVHAMARDLAEDVMLVEQRHGHELGEEAGLAALDRLPQPSEQMRRRAGRIRSPTSSPSRVRRARPRSARSVGRELQQQAPGRSARTRRPSSSSTRRVASAAAAARSLPPNVEPWRTARSMPSNTRSKAARETSTAPIGTIPPDSALDQADQVGLQIPVLAGRHRPVRPMPVWTSSQTNSAPASRHRALGAEEIVRQEAGSRPCPARARRQTPPRRHVRARAATRRIPPWHGITAGQQRPEPVAKDCHRR